MLERLNLPRLATVALCGVIGLQLAWIATGWLGSRDTPSAADPATELARDFLSLNLDAEGVDPEPDGGGEPATVHVEPERRTHAP